MPTANAPDAPRTSRKSISWSRCDRAAPLHIGPPTKSLSDNSGSAICYPGTGKVEHSKIVVQTLLPTDEQPSEPIQPAMAALDHPTAGAVTGEGLFFLPLLASAADVGCVSVPCRQLLNLSKVIALVQTQMLRLSRSGNRTFCHHRFQCRLNHLHVVAVGSIHTHPYGNTVPLCQQTAFGPLLAPVCRVWPSALTPRAEPLSWLHPLPATANLFHAVGRIQTTPASIAPRRLRRLANAGIGHAQCSEHRTCEATLSTGSRSAARRRFHPYTLEQVSMASRPSDSSPPQAATAQSSPTEHRESANHRLHHHDQSSTSRPSTIKMEETYAKSLISSKDN